MNQFLTPATVSVALGSILSIGVGFADAGWFHFLGRDVDVMLLAGGVGALLGHNPLNRVATP